MIDVHSHIVFEVDDGSKSLEQSIEIIKEGYKAGFEKIIATPHYIEGYYENNVQEIEKRITIIEEELKKINCPAKILQGNEIYITENMQELFENQKATTLNQQQYILFELPLNSEVINLERIIYQILEIGAVPVLAHPERYPFVQKDPNALIPIIEKGVLIQSNYGSIIGQYRKEAQTTIKKMLEHGMVHFLGSDVHRPQTIYPKVNECINEIEKIIGKEMLEELTSINPEKAINGEKIEIDNPTYIKTNFFTKLFH